MNHYQQAKFFTSANALTELPTNATKEVAFVGRSNAGKSSVLNTLTEQKKLAKASKTPGRTRLINYFSITETNYLVDLPGYGFAKVSNAMRNHWKIIINNYLTTRKVLKGLVVVMDIRHFLKPEDEKIIQWAAAANLECHALLTKCDKLKQGATLKIFRDCQQKLNVMNKTSSVSIFSALKKKGVKELRQTLDSWFEY